MSSDKEMKGWFEQLEAVHRLREARQHGGQQGLREQKRALLELKQMHEQHHRQRDEERARRRGRKPLDAAAIAAAAVAIADAQGVDEVSMRKIAAVLGSGTMSLYHYVRTKEDLLALMDDLIMGEILVPAHELKAGWRKSVSAIARHTRDAYRRHPWALTIRSNGRPGINGLRHVEQSMAALAPTGLSFEDKLTIIVIIDDFVFGHALRAAESRFEQENYEGALDDVAAFMNHHLVAPEFPELRREVGDGDIGDFIRKMAVAFRPEEWFESGLEIMLDGLAKRFGLKD